MIVPRPINIQSWEGAQSGEDYPNAEELEVAPISGLICSH